MPVFFVISGYFMLDNEMQLSGKRLYNKIKHIGFMLLLHILLYIGYELLSKTVLGNSPIETLLSTYFNAKALAKAVFIGTGIMGGGEWFLVSLIDAYIVLGALILVRKIGMYIIRYAHVIAVILFLIHIPIRMYAISSGIISISGLSILESYSVRNTWLDAIPFMLLGISIRMHNFKVSHPIIITSFAMVIAVGECFFTNKMLEPEKMNAVLYVGVIIAVVASMIWAVGDRGKENFLSVIGSKYSMLIFFLHPIVGWVMKAVLPIKFYQGNTLSECFFSIEVMICVTAISYVAIKIRDLIKRKG